MNRKLLTLAPLLVALCGAAAPTGCVNGQLDPSAEARITAAYNVVCPALGALSGLSMNARQAQAYAAAQAICGNGAPTNLLVAGLDLVTVQAALAPLLARVKVRL